MCTPMATKKASLFCSVLKRSMPEVPLPPMVRTCTPSRSDQVPPLA